KREELMNHKGTEAQRKKKEGRGKKIRDGCKERLLTLNYCPFPQSSLEDFRDEPGVLTPGGSGGSVDLFQTPSPIKKEIKKNYPNSPGSIIRWNR
ncbi:MAG: hypothetical protein RLZZ338_918, partial [Cyanobacteriota bacterium]